MRFHSMGASIFEGTLSGKPKGTHPLWGAHIPSIPKIPGAHAKNEAHVNRLYLPAERMICVGSPVGFL